MSKTLELPKIYNIYKQLITCKICSGTLILQIIDFSIGFDVMRYVRPFSANLVSKCPALIT